MPDTKLQPVHKSPGPDQIPNWFLRDFSVWLAEPVCCIFNVSLLSGIFPQSWKQANVIPILKVNSPTSIQSDLRPISLTPSLCKILELYVGNWILDRVTAKLDPRQFGALRGRSTLLPMLWSICYTLGIKPLINVSLSECYLSTFIRPSIVLTKLKS